MRLFLHLRLADGRVIEDVEGVDCRDLAEAEQRASEYAEELLKEYQQVTHGTVEIADEAGRVIHVLEVTNGTHSIEQ